MDESQKHYVEQKKPDRKKKVANVWLHLREVNKERNFFLTFYFVVEYSQLTMLW